MSSLKFATLTLYDDRIAHETKTKCKFCDVQLWLMPPKSSSTSAIPRVSIPQDSVWRRIGYISMHLIPLYLFCCKPFKVYSDLDSTIHYFKECVANVQAPYGLLFAHPTSRQYVLFHPGVHSNSEGILASCIEFAAISKAITLFDSITVAGRLSSGKAKLSKSVLMGDLSKITPGSTSIQNTNVFDRVLEAKKQSGRPQNSVRPDSFSQLQPSPKLVTPKPRRVNPDQINYIIGKLVLAGLRVRGISTNLTHLLNERLSIKELYQMTVRAATFALRKYASLLLPATTSKPELIRKRQDPVPLEVLQDIVERLLEVFVDVDDRSAFK